MGVTHPEEGWIQILMGEQGDGQPPKRGGFGKIESF
jgi:hypothetical protein